jgi:nitric oxide dioxygenase
MLSLATLSVVRATAPALAEHAQSITKQFYQLMLTEHPELWAYFNPAHQQSGRQSMALANAIVAYATHIENLAVLLPAVELIAQKHCSLGVQPEHYPIVGKYLLRAIRDVLGDAATDDVLTAWGEAYQLLADVLIEREAAIYNEQQSQPGGWKGFRTFVVERKVPECEAITSFYLKPADEQPLPEFKPGQYITVKLPPHSNGFRSSEAGGTGEVPRGLLSPRNYSLSDQPGKDYFRISVKREAAHQEIASVDGLVSNYLHDGIHEGDRLEVGPPCGEFSIDPVLAAKKPLVFVAGGVGITPLLSMLKTVVAEQPQQPIRFIVLMRNSGSHSHRKELIDLATRCPQLKLHLHYSQPLENDRRGDGFHTQGPVDRNLLKELLATHATETEYYFCGPSALMQEIISALSELQIDPSQIHYEFFGPKVALAMA